MIDFSSHLFSSAPDPACRISVILPAKNEEALLPHAIAALASQRDDRGMRLDPRSYEVLVLLNNCDDGSRAVLERTAEAYPELRLCVEECTFLPEQAHAGTARRVLMDAAVRRLSGRDRRKATLISTDADTVVSSTWVDGNCQALSQGADVVGGLIELGKAECNLLARHQPELLLAYSRDRRYQGLVAHLESVIDPDPYDPWPRHLDHFGASLGCTVEVYERAGGLPPVSPLEDVAFVDALRRVGARIRHAPEVRVTTSGRLDGRAPVGLSWQLRQWSASGAIGRQRVQSLRVLVHRFETIAMLRRVHTGTNTMADKAVLRRCMAHVNFTEPLRQQVPFGQFLTCIDVERLIDSSYSGARHSREQEISSVLADLERHLGEGARVRQDETAPFAPSALLATLAG